MEENPRLSRLEAISGGIKGRPEDFVVEEITKTGVTIESGRRYSARDLGMEERDGKFCIFVMEKNNWNTTQACREVAGKAGRGFKSVGFAGTKDRRAVTTQLCSLYGADPERLLSVHVKDVSINGVWKSDSEVSMGDLLGNRFTIIVTTEDALAADKVSAIEGELHGLFPNYFGPQRFGARGNNVRIGVSILKGDFEAAAMAFLADTTGERNADAITAREKLSEDGDFKAALSYFPGYLKYELRMLDYLAVHPTDFANAIRRLPRQIALMLVHSVESYIFNAELAARMMEGRIQPEEGDIVCGSDGRGFPDLAGARASPGTFNEGARFAVGNIIGYGTPSLNRYESGIMDGLGLKREDFMVKRMPELNCRGSQRVLFAPYTGFEAAGGEGRVMLRFSLPAGSYATALLDEFVRHGGDAGSAGVVGREGQEEA